MKQYEKNITSQWGEDGVIEEIFNRIGETSRICVDIGSWDGKYFSNSYSLAQKGWQRLLVEASRDRALQTNPFPGDVVTIEKAMYLDDVISKSIDCPKEFDLLTIDVDGDDYYLWADMEKYYPRVVCIEYNQTAAPGIDVKQERGGSFGASSKALLDLAREKRYHFVHATTTNLLFVQSALGYMFPHPSGIPTKWVTYGAIGYNGKKYFLGEQAHNDDQGGKHEKLITGHKITEV